MFLLENRNNWIIIDKCWDFYACNCVLFVKRTTYSEINASPTFSNQTVDKMTKYHSNWVQVRLSVFTILILNLMARPIKNHYSCL